MSLWLKPDWSLHIFLLNHCVVVGGVYFSMSVVSSSAVGHILLIHINNVVILLS